MTIRPVALLAIVLGWSVSARAHSFPKKAPSLRSSLVQNYPPCISPDGVTGNGESACVGAAEVDPSCVFTSRGVGSFAVSVRKTKLAVVASLVGLDPQCEGKVLTAAVGVRVTSDTCPDDHCTSVDREIAAGTCTVKNGRCSLKNAVDPGYEAGSGAEMTVLTCGVKNGTLATFACGVMIR